MRYYPIFLDLDFAKVIFSGAGEVAVAKIRLLLKTNAKIYVFGENPHADILSWANEKKIILHRRHLAGADLHRLDLQDAKLLYAANGNKKLDSRARNLAKQFGIFVNVVDNLQQSDFLTPALVDRAPITVAIGTEGTAPVLARKIKLQIENLLPLYIGKLAKLAADFRPIVARISSGKQRREFWQKFFSTLPQNKFDVAKARNQLVSIFNEIKNTKQKNKGYVSFIVGDGNAESLSTLARQRLFNADIIIYENKIEKSILELARREAQFILLNKKMLNNIFAKTKQGLHIVCLSKSILNFNKNIAHEIIAHEIIKPEKIRGAA